MFLCLFRICCCFLFSQNCLPMSNHKSFAYQKTGTLHPANDIKHPRILYTKAGEFHPLGFDWMRLMSASLSAADGPVATYG